MRFLESLIYRWIVRPILFQFDAEEAHEFVFKIAAWFFRYKPTRTLVQLIFHPSKEPLFETKLAGLDLKNPIGLAAGFDKNARLIEGIHCLGFGFVEIGTITPRPQIGNPKPRLQRIPERHAVLNRMGFNNDGSVVIAERLAKARSEQKIQLPLGVNIGKNKDTPNEDAVADYERLLIAFRSLASYFVVNISSPNTPGLRDLQSEAFTTALASRISALKIAQPVFIKLGPDVSNEHFSTIGRLCGAGKPFSGLVLTNTIPTDLGGISGRPLKGPALMALKAARKNLGDSVPLIAVGGIETAEDIIDRLENGASAIQLYSSLIYEGPGLAARLLYDLNVLLKRKGVRSLNALRGF